MNYFQCVSLVSGILITLFSAFIFLFTGVFQNWMKRFLREERPFWIVLLSGFALALVTATWIQLFQNMNAYTGVVTAILTLFLLKLFVAVFCYKPFRSFSIHFLGEDQSTLRMFSLPSFLIGILLILLSSAS